MSLDQPLLKSADYGMTASELMELFKPDNIRNGSSTQLLARLGKLDGIYQKLNTDPKKGLNANDVSDLDLRVKNFGDNKPIEKEQKKLLDYILENFEDKILQILCLAAFVNLIIGVITEGWAEGWMDGFAIFIAVIIIVSVTAGNNYIKDQQFRKLNAIAANRNINVIRGGKTISISIYDLLVGDIVYVETGEIMPCDGVVIEANNLKSDESSITGEPDAVEKFPPTNYQDNINAFLISNCSVAEGNGLIICLAVGENTYYGQTKKLMTEQGADDKTPLQEKLNILADQIGEYGMKAAQITFAAMCIHLIIEDIYLGIPLFTFHTLKEILNFFIVGVIVVVVAVPEGLPLAVTIALAYSVGKMKDENNLVRFLSACETMGGANNICSDKTGTLTENKMTVVSLYTEENDFSKLDPKAISPSTLLLICEGIILNSSAHPQVDEYGKFEQIGNKTDCALLEMSYKFGYDFRQVRKTGEDKVKRKFPFSSEKKKQTTIIDYKNDKVNFRIYTKGAPDYLIDKCSHYLNSKGQQTIITPEFKQRLLQVLKNYSSQSLRSIILTSREQMIPGRPEKPEQFGKEEDYEQKLVFIAIAGIQDPLREGIPEAVQRCKDAGVIVRMVTGDNKDTAIAISKKAGILPQNYEYNSDSLMVLEGKTFRELVGGIKFIEENKVTKPVVGDLENFRQVANELRVLARSSPEDKFILVTGLKQLDNVVAVTGDGTNDAPALKKADIGFAMGIQGTEVAKEASGIILLDDNFSSIVTAIKWGRNIFDCIRKFLQFQVTVNIVAVFMVFLGGVILKESPLASIQMLWVNLIMDTLASLALATEPPSNELLKRKPYGKKEHMINAGMWRNIICQSLFQIFVLLLVLFYGDTMFGIKSSRGHQQEDEYNPEDHVHYTMFFHIFVFLQVFNEINSRKLKKEEVNVFEGFFNNPMFLFVIVGTIVVQIAIVEFGGKAVKVVKLTFGQHLTCIFIGTLSLAVGYFIKQIPDSYFDKIELFKEQIQSDVDPNTLEGKMKRPSTLLRKKRQIEQPQQKKGGEIELKVGANNFKK